MKMFHGLLIAIVGNVVGTSPILAADVASPAQQVGSPANKLVILVDQGKDIINRNIFGHFSEHLGRGIYEGLWVGTDSPIPNTRSIRNDVVAALRRIKVPVLRWPGGCFADEYHWQDGIGPYKDRPSIVNTHWGGVTENNHFGTHEWKAARIHFQRKTQQWLRNPQANSNHITHGMADAAQCAARLGEGEVLYEVLSRLATRRYIFPSMMMSYWPGLNGFGFDPVGTIPEAINNALVFSRDGVVDLLPALPRAWTRGELRGTLARGQLKIDSLAWNILLGRIRVQLTSRKDQTFTLRIPGARKLVNMRVTGAEALVSSQGKNCRDITVKAGRAVKMEFQVSRGLPYHE